jgi:sulfate permease, SulP family
VDGDFIGQGVGNALSGLIRGQPVGGSVGQTALSVSSGARSRWASILSGVWILVILLLVSGAVGKVAMPTLAAILIFAGVGSLQPAQVRTILHTGTASRIALAATFVATLLLSVAVAVGIGVVLSLLLQLNREAIDLTVTELRPLADGRLREGPAPRRLRSDAVTLLDVHGSLLFAGARTLQARRPDRAGAHRPGGGAAPARPGSRKDRDHRLRGHQLALDQPNGIWACNLSGVHPRVHPPQYRAPAA